MAVFMHLETDTGTNVDISSATAVGAYTANGDKLIMVDVSIDAVAGNGDYVMYVTRQIGGSGSAYRILPQTTMTAASGLTAISAQSGWITVRNGDVLTCYVDGLAGDTATPDWTTRWFELAGVTASAIADAVLDEATADHTTAGSLSKAVADVLADTGTDGVVLKAAGLNADAVTKIQSGLALEATLTAIKGAGWNNGTLQNIKNDTESQQTVLQEIKGEDWTDETLTALMTAIAAIQAGSGATPQQIWEYTTRVLTAGTNIDLSALATAADLATLDGKVDTVDGILDDLHDTDIPAIKTETAAIKAKTDLIPASPAEAGEYTAAIAAVKSVADDILVDTGTTLDALIKDIPTNAELATALGTADDAVLAAVAAAKVVIDDIHNTDLPAVKAETAEIKAKTDNLPASPAAVGSAMTLTAAYDKAKDDVLTPLAVVDSIVDGLKTTLDNIHDTDLPAVKTETAAIKAKTDNLPATPASAGEYTAAIAAIPTAPLLAANYVAPNNSGIASILEDTGTTIPATLAGLATSAEVGAITMLDEVVVGSYTMQDILKILAAKMVGKATGGGTTTITYRGVDDTSDVIIETVDSNGNRSAVTLTV